MMGLVHAATRRLFSELYYGARSAAMLIYVKEFIGLKRKHGRRRTGVVAC